MCKQRVSVHMMAAMIQGTRKCAHVKASRRSGGNDIKRQNLMSASPNENAYVTSGSLDPYKKLTARTLLAVTYVGPLHFQNGGKEANKEFPFFAPPLQEKRGCFAFCTHCETLYAHVRCTVFRTTKKTATQMKQGLRHYMMFTRCAVYS